jgi:hypothetical protein
MATTHLALLSVAHWEDLQKGFEPNFIQKSGSDEEGNVLKTSLVGAQSTISSATVNIGVSLGTTSEPNLVKGNSGPGVPSPSLPDPNKIINMPSPTLEHDKILTRQLATALVQETHMLNNYTKYVPQKEGYGAYVVRLQLTVLPSQRTVQDDVFADIAFYSGPDVYWPEVLGKAPRHNKGNTVPGPIILPILVTDNMETALRLYSNQEILQLSLNMALAAKGVGAKADVTYWIDKIRQMVGADLNSLFTVARVNDSMIRVRLGANQRAENGVGYALTPRTHYITLLMLAREYHDPDPNKADVYAVMRTHLHNAETGDKENTKTVSDLANGVGRVLDEYLDGYFLKGQIKEILKKNLDANMADMYDLLMAVELSKYEKFYGKWCGILGGADPNVPSKFQEALWGLMRLRETKWYDPNWHDANNARSVVDRCKAAAPLVWLELTSLCAGRFSVVPIDLPPERATMHPSIQKEQVALATDDGNIVTAILRNGWHLTNDTVMATLVCGKESNVVRLPASSVVCGPAHDVRMTFPSPQRWRLETFGEANIVLRGLPDANDLRYIPDAKPAPDACFKVIFPQVRRPEPATILKDQVALATDDGNSLTAVLRNGSGLTNDTVMAQLQFGKEPSRYVLPASNVVTGPAHDVTITFPSPKRWGLEAPREANIVLSGAPDANQLQYLPGGKADPNAWFKVIYREQPVRDVPPSAKPATPTTMKGTIEFPNVVVEVEVTPDRSDANNKQTHQ